MKGISWGNLPRYFFKEYKTGLSVNAVALGCKVEMMRQEFPPLPCIKQTAPPPESSEQFLNGFKEMKQIICEEKSENNPVSFLTKAIYNSVCCHHITETEFFFQYEKPHNSLLKNLSCLHNIRFPKASFNFHKGCNDTDKLLIIIESRNTMQEQDKPSLYELRQNMQKSKQPRITITLPNYDEYFLGILFALLAATDKMLEHLSAQSSNTEEII